MSIPIKNHFTTLIGHKSHKESNSKLSSTLCILQVFIEIRTVHTNAVKQVFHLLYLRLHYRKSKTARRDTKV